MNPPEAHLIEPGVILLAIESPGDRVCIEQTLGSRHRLLHAQSGEDVLPLAVANKPDLILLDRLASPLDGYALCAYLKAEPQTAHLPVILLAASRVCADEVRGLELGAIDYLAKPVDPDILLARVHNHLALKRIQDHLEATNRHLASLATTDTLTGLVNRRGLLARLEAEHARSQRTQHPFALAICDLDYFKRVNDTYGHAAGDQVLASFAATLRENLRTIDLAARWGGEEFAILFPESSARDAVVPLERLRQAVAALRIHHAGQAMTVTVSIGVAEYCIGDDLIEHLLERADTALYAAKSGGRNRVVRSTTQTHHDACSLACFKLVWHAHYASGHPLIDAQHQGLFQDANELLIAILEAHPNAQIVTLAERLLTDTVAHFKDEEAVLRTFDYPELEAHQVIHAALVARGIELFEALRRGEGEPGVWFQFLAHEVVVQHMLQVDRDYFPLLAGHTDAPAS